MRQLALGHWEQFLSTLHVSDKLAATVCKQDSVTHYLPHLVLCLTHHAESEEQRITASLCDRDQNASSCGVVPESIGPQWLRGI